MRKIVIAIAVISFAGMLLLVVAIFLGYVSEIRGQATAAALTFFATLLYVVLTADMLLVMKQQQSLQQKVICRFGLTKRDRKAFVWVANLGFTNFLVMQITFVAQAGSQVLQDALHHHRVVAVGQRRLFRVPEDLYIEAKAQRDIHVRVDYLGPDEQEQSVERGFVLLITDGEVQKIKRGRTEQHGMKAASWTDSQ